MKKLLICLAALPLTSCAAAIPLYMAASYGYSAFTVYKMYDLANVEGAKYEVEKSTPAASDLDALKSASTLAVFPSATSADGVVVDTLSERSSFSVVSSKKTIEIIEAKNITQERLMSYPAADRAEEIVNFGKSAGADVVLLANIGSSEVRGTNMLAANAGVDTAVNVKLYDVSSGRILLEENHKIKIDAGSSPSAAEIAQIAAMGIGDRLKELRGELPPDQAFLPADPFQQGGGRVLAGY
jgi:hypothetical protein